MVALQDKLKLFRDCSVDKFRNIYQARAFYHLFFLLNKFNYLLI
jgi:hypothetical protein